MASTIPRHLGLKHHLPVRRQAGFVNTITNRPVVRHPMTAHRAHQIRQISMPAESLWADLLKLLRSEARVDCEVGTAKLKVKSKNQTITVEPNPDYIKLSGSHGQELYLRDQAQRIKIVHAILFNKDNYRKGLTEQAITALFEAYPHNTHGMMFALAQRMDSSTPSFLRRAGQETPLEAMPLVWTGPTSSCGGSDR